MQRPDSVTNEDILRWSEIIDSDPNMPAVCRENAVIREVCYAGQWLREKLEKLKCDEVMITRITYTAGYLSHGRDIWKIHQRLLEDYINDDLEYEQDVE